VVWLELFILLACIVAGARLGGIALGTIAGLGLVIFVFLLGAPPGGPPGAVLGMIIAVITALAAMQAVGGLDYLVQVAQRLLHKHPQYITFLAPAVTYVLVAASGTQHVIYALLPVIAEVSRGANIRPERPLSISVIAAQHGVIASPISAATVALLGVLAGADIGLGQIVAIIVPSTFLAVMIGALSVAWKGRALSDDPVYQERLASWKVEAIDAIPELEGKALRVARGATLLFLGAIALVVIVGLYPELRPSYAVRVGDTLQYDQIDMAAAIMIVMLAIAGITMLVFRASPEETVKGSIMRSGIVAFISILGIAWLGSSFFEHNRDVIVGGISGVIEGRPWVFALGLFALSVVLFSQAATVVTLMPVGLALGIPPTLMIVLYPATNGPFFLPTYGTVLAAVAMDQTGTTRIGRYLLNHSFMVPGLVTTSSAVCLAWLFSRIVGL
jgi:anaerobic C4-dicarboxylate transporter-like protein